MPILRKLKSLIGVDDADDESDRDVTVTVEHDPENEAAVKGADVEESTTAGGSQAVAVSESETGGDDEAAGASAEPAGDETPEPASAGAADSAAEGVAPGEQVASSDAAPDEVEIQDAEESEYSDTDETETSADGEPVDVLNGIGPAYAQRLGDAGIETVGELADADAAALSDATEIAEGRIQGWIDQAGEY